MSQLTSKGCWVRVTAEVRRGGLAGDFKGATHMTVLWRMGILEARVRAWLTSGCEVPYQSF